MVFKTASIFNSITLIRRSFASIISSSFSFSPKKPFQILAERRVPRREATSFNFAKSENWQCVLDEVRMYFGQNPQDFDE
ncbi:MAG: hypothetical protein A3E07_03280 [Candidatus Wildermuthbacteria bacterium RIFCSPHIGHO2_12_FULL_45_9]|nr:MAG: hypothetical protein A3E07_03280 [Candidatus Wildermuthbacteria bacterium RIFCSPHIGHO2_12_FULL_45_9]